MWAEIGPLGLLVFLALITAGLRRGARVAWHSGDLFIWGAIGLLVAMLVRSLVSYPLRLPFNGMIYT